MGRKIQENSASELDPLTKVFVAIALVLTILEVIAQIYQNYFPNAQIFLR